MKKEIDDLYLLLEKYFFTTNEAIDYLGITRNTFYSLVNRNKITKIKKNGVVLYSKKEIESRYGEMANLRAKYRPYE